MYFLLLYYFNIISFEKVAMKLFLLLLLLSLLFVNITKSFNAFNPRNVRLKLIPKYNIFQLKMSSNNNEEEQYPMNPLDVYPSSISDEEVLDALRKERMISNDIWQSTLFRDTHCGSWIGYKTLSFPLDFFRLLIYLFI